MTVDAVSCGIMNLDSSTQPIDRLLTRKDAADILQISISTLERHINGGRIRVAKIGHATRIRPSELARFVESREGNLPEMRGQSVCAPILPQA